MKNRYPWISVKQGFDISYSTGLAMVDRLEAVATFARLLERSDKEALDAISRILVILKEAKQPWQ